MNTLSNAKETTIYKSTEGVYFGTIFTTNNLNLQNVAWYVKKTNENKCQTLKLESNRVNFGD